MSRRHLKKIQEAKLGLQGSDHSDNEYEPPCVKESFKSTYEGVRLMLIKNIVYVAFCFPLFCMINILAPANICANTLYIC